MTLDRILEDGGWRVAITHPETSTPICAPTILTPRHSENRIIYRAACRHCGWIAEHVDVSENDAVETAHDHSHPRYRTLPTVDLPTGWRQTPTSKPVVAARELVAQLYPDGWVASGVAPNWTYRQPHAGRHVPSVGLFGGYDLARPNTPATDHVAVGAQGALFS